MTFPAAATTASPATTAAAVNYTITSVFTAMGMAVIIHRAEGLEKVQPMRTMKPAVSFSITRNGKVIDRLETPVDFNGGSNPNWDCYGELMFNSTPSTVETDSLVLKVKHHGSVLGNRLIGEAVVPMADLRAGDGIGREMSYSLFRSGKEVGNIIVSHEIKQLEDQISPDLAGETRNGNSPAQGVGVGNDGPPLGGRRRFKMSDAFASVAGGASLGVNVFDYFQG